MPWPHARARSGAALGSHTPADKDCDRASLKSERESTEQTLDGLEATQCDPCRHRTRSGLGTGPGLELQINSPFSDPSADAAPWFLGPDRHDGPIV